MPLYVEIVTPDGIAWKSSEVEDVTIPTQSGEIEILPGHVPLVTIVEAGDVTVHHGGKTEDIAVDKGYARCIGDHVSILTEAAVEFDKIDEKAAEDARAEALKSLEEAKNRREIDPEEVERLESVVRFAIAQQLTKARRH